MLSPTLLLPTLLLSGTTLSTASRLHPLRKAYPFNQLVAFGDELSDNGNGSYAHGITGNPANVYGFGTWTCGPVAVSYLANLLGVPLVDYAWGGSNGGSSGGATIDNAYSPASAKWNGQPVPSVQQQIFSNYTAAGSGAVSNIASALQFIWIGENELSAKTYAGWPDAPVNQWFAGNMSAKILADAEYLAQKGAPYVFVAGIYPKNLAPVTKKYLCPDGSCVDSWGQVIRNTNAKIQASLKGSKYAKRFIFYDTYAFMVKVMDNKDGYGLTAPLDWFCDGQNDGNWTACISGSYTWQGATKYYWMNFIQPTTTVHRLIAQDMKSTIDSFLAAS